MTGPGPVILGLKEVGKDLGDDVFEGVAAVVQAQQLADNVQGFSEEGFHVWGVSGEVSSGKR